MTAAALQGGCQCGAVRYACASPPLQVFLCHCTECRRQSSSAFGISVQVPLAAFALTRGTPRCWSRATASGATLDCWFCPDCGSRLWHQTRGDAETLNLKGGSIDGGIDLGQVVHIWTASRLPGIRIPDDAVQFPHEPPSRNG